MRVLRPARCVVAAATARRGSPQSRGERGVECNNPEFVASPPLPMAAL